MCPLWGAGLSGDPFPRTPILLLFVGERGDKLLLGGEIKGMYVLPSVAQGPFVESGIEIPAQFSHHTDFHDGFEESLHAWISNIFETKGKSFNFSIRYTF